MEHSEICNSWRAVIEATLDVDGTVIEIKTSKAQQLEAGIRQGGCYLLTLEACYNVELVNVIDVSGNQLVVERAHGGTLSSIWPAGTLLEARIPVRTLDDLRLDAGQLLKLNGEVRVAPNGDLITKPFV